jgi:acetyl esterase/lipase
VGSPRTSVLVVAGPGEHPDGCREATERHADRLELSLSWREADDEPTLISLLRGVDAHDAVVLASGSLADADPVAAVVCDLDRPVVHVEAGPITHREVVHEACDRVIHGRRRRSFTDALSHLVAEHLRPSATIAYGEHPAQVGDLRLPDRAPDGSAPAPVVVLLHGGYWLDPYERDLMGRLAVALTDTGWATWNVEYRRRGPSGGGWPETLEDACTALDAVADLTSDHPVDHDRVVLVGHSAGAQLALYAATRASAPPDAPGRVPRVSPIGVVSLAGVLDLAAGAADDLADGAVEALIGPLDEHPDRYEVASPIRRLPCGLPLLAVHGPDDHLVPVTQTIAFSEAARSAGDEIEMALIDTPHLDIVDPTGPATPVVSAWLERYAASRGVGRSGADAPSG